MCIIAAEGNDTVLFFMVQKTSDSLLVFVANFAELPAAESVQSLAPSQPAGAEEIRGAQ